MAEIENLNEYANNPILAHYGGNAGQKSCYIIDGKPWMIKFPERTDRFTGQHLVPYNTSPISEYIGSRIYASLGIDVHEVRLGARETVSADGKASTKIVAMCRDFATDAPIVCYGDVKSSSSGELYPNSSNGSNPKGEPLTDVLTTIDHADLFEMAGRDRVLERFWDMFVTDAFIRNSDRNNGNWGLQITSWGSVLISPVFDNGNCLYNKLNQSGASIKATDEDQIAADVKSVFSFFTDSTGSRIRSYGLIESGEHKGLTDALCRFMERADMDAIRDIVSGVPETYEDTPVLPAEIRELIVKTLERAYTAELEPAWRSLCPRAVPVESTFSHSASRAATDRERHMQDMALEIDGNIEQASAGRVSRPSDTRGHNKAL